MVVLECRHYTSFATADEKQLKVPATDLVGSWFVTEKPPLPC